MKKQIKLTPDGSRTWLAVGTMGFAAIAITVLAIVSICQQPEETMTIFNIILPVMASWIGTILAFYFGRENFESANKSMREIIDKLSPEQREQSSVKSIMRSLFNIVHYQIPKGKTDKDVLVSDLRKLLQGNISRLPIIDADEKPLYIIHASIIDNYLSLEGKEDDNLEKFISEYKKKKIQFGFGHNRGFLIASEDTNLGNAKQSLKDKPTCQDIFITKGGTKNEALTGWISNIRMEKYFQ